MKAAAIASVLLLIGCSYRGQPPPPLSEPLAITVSTNQGRLVRSQAALQSAVARELASQLGWSISPAGSARLTLAITEERFEVVASGTLGIPERWRVQVLGEWRLDSRDYGEQQGGFTASGYYRDRLGEAAALDDAARSAARDIAASLRHRLSPAPIGE